MRPQGRDLKPHTVLAMVESDRDHSVHEGRPVSVYRHETGEAYALGFSEESTLWAHPGYSPMGTVAFIRDQMAAAQEVGLKEDSVPWYLLNDVEREEQAAR